MPARDVSESCECENSKQRTAIVYMTERARISASFEGRRLKLTTSCLHLTMVHSLVLVSVRLDVV